VDVRRLDEWAGGWAIRELSDAATASAIENEERERAERRNALSAEAVSIESDLTEIARRLGRREAGWTLARHDAICKPLEERLLEIERELGDVAAEPSAESSGYYVHTPRDYERLTLLERWDSGGNAERRAIVKMALRGRRIVVRPGRSARFDDGRVSVD
jgi:hypothetical protein